MPQRQLTNRSAQTQIKDTTSSPSLFDVERRFYFVDYLRALAIVGVIIFHFSLPFHSYLPHDTHCLTNQLFSIAQLGRLGVQLFFVISGFVIAHSLRTKQLTFKTALRFLLRRIVRLDPPYWCTIACCLLVSCLGSVLHKGRSIEQTSIPAIAAHLVYLEFILKFNPLLESFWTLCYELQFYLMFSLMMVAAARLCPFTPIGKTAYGIIVLPVFFSSIFSSDCHPQWAFATFYIFLSGAIAYWAVSKMLPLWYLTPVVAALVARIGQMADPQTIVALFSSVLLALMASRTAHPSNSRPCWKRLAQLGRMSYSLYLLHPLVYAVLNYHLRPLFGKTVWALWSIVCLTTVATAAASFILYEYIEKPAMTYSKRIPIEFR